MGYNLTGGYIPYNYTLYTQLCEEYNKPLNGSLLKTTIIKMESKRVFFVAHVVFRREQKSFS